MNQKELRHVTVQKAIDTTFSGMTMTPQMQYRVLQEARGETKTKKKLSLGLVLAIVLVLVTITAVAAVLLSAREITENHGIPIANQSDGDSYSVEETNILLTLARENGIELSDSAMINIQKSLEQGIGYFKEEMLMALAKAEFGEAPDAWTLEQQKWFDDVCVAIGFIAVPQKAMPSQSEITQSDAERIAEAYIHSRYDPSVNLNDTTVYKRGVQYIDGNADGEYPGLYWSLSYEALTVDATTYWIYINSRGEVWGEHIMPGVASGTPFDFIRSRYESTFGWDVSKWNQAELREFKAASSLSSSTNDRAVLCINQTEYPDIAANAMKPEQAAQIASKALQLNDYVFESAVYIGDAPNPIWKVVISVVFPEGSYDATDPFAGYAYYYVEIDSVTGDVKSIYQRPNGYDDWHRNIVLQKTFEAIDATWVDTTPSFG